MLNLKDHRSVLIALRFDKSNLKKLKSASINVEVAYSGYKLYSAFGTSDQKRKFESS